MFLIYFLAGVNVFAGKKIYSAKDSLKQENKIKFLAAGAGLVYTSSLIVLSQTWYKEKTKIGFHFFNDSHEWKQQDKIGHFWTSFHESHLGVSALKAANAPEKKAIVYGSLLGFILQTPIELLDGYAANYGASVSDIGANALGSLAVMAQELGWQEIRIVPKYSFHQTNFAKLRPNVLGSTYSEELLKDYNGQTYWLSADISAFLAPDSKYPKWLNVAIGHGANGMVYGNPTTNSLNGYKAYRQYFLALDLNLTNIKTRHKFLKKAFHVLNIVHLPAPALEYNYRKGLQFHPVYF